MPTTSIPLLDPVIMRYNDRIVIPAASGYNFTTPGNTHGLGILRINPGHAINPGLIDMVEGPLTEYDLTAGFTSEFLIDGNPNFITVGTDDVLIVNPATFTVEDEFYLLGIFDLSLGPVTRHLLDLKLIFIEKFNLDIFDSTTATVDEATLRIAEGLAGHNAKMRNAEFIAGQLSAMEIALFNDTLVLGLTEADLISDAGLESQIDVLHTTDNLGDVINSQTRQTL